MKKMVKVRLTDDPAINREAMPPEMLEEIDMIQSYFGKMKLIDFRVEQGSDAAKRVSQALQKHANK